jgi:uncharacterized membrane protein YdjX (TVP38/TMEM64 family)
MPSIHPSLYLLLLSAAVGLGLPAGPLVVGAGALFGAWIGVPVVLAGEALGLALNWRLCRGLLRPRLQAWLERRRRGRRLRLLLQQPAGVRLIVLLRLAAIPMNLVNAACALGPTPLRSYALASLVLVPRFSLMVWAGSLGAQAARGALSPLALTLRAVALAATAAVLWLLARSLRRGLEPIELQEAEPDTPETPA